jgi:ferredoxin
MRIRVEIDRSSCLATGNCARTAPRHFRLDDTGRPSVRSGSGDAPSAGVTSRLDDDESGRVREAAMFCPPEAISLWDADTGDQLFP